MTLSQKLAIKLVQFLRLIKNQILMSQVGGLSKCRFEETCGNYLSRQIKEAGVKTGLFLGFKRIISCQGWL